jgi:hypothetical protein
MRSGTARGNAYFYYVCTVCADLKSKNEVYSKLSVPSIQVSPNYRNYYTDPEKYEHFCGEQGRFKWLDVSVQGIYRFVLQIKTMKSIFRETVAESKQSGDPPKITDSKFQRKIVEAHPSDTAEAMSFAPNLHARKQAFKTATNSAKITEIDPMNIPQELWVIFK